MSKAYGLRKCPVCGEKYNIKVNQYVFDYGESVVNEWTVCCGNCGHETTDFPTKQEAIDNWENCGY